MEEEEESGSVEVKPREKKKRKAMKSSGPVQGLPMGGYTSGPAVASTAYPGLFSSLTTGPVNPSGVLMSGPRVEEYVPHPQEGIGGYMAEVMQPPFPVAGYYEVMGAPGYGGVPMGMEPGKVPPMGYSQLIPQYPEYPPHPGSAPALVTQPPPPPIQGYPSMPGMMPMLPAFQHPGLEQDP